MPQFKIKLQQFIRMRKPVMIIKKLFYPSVKPQKKINKRIKAVNDFDIVLALSLKCQQMSVAALKRSCKGRGFYAP